LEELGEVDLQEVLDLLNRYSKNSKKRRKRDNNLWMRIKNILMKRAKMNRLYQEVTLIHKRMNLQE